MRLENKVTLVSDGDMGADVTSAVQDLQQMFGYSVVAVWSGAAPVGVISLEASDDNIVFITVANSSVNISGDGNYMWNVTDVMYRYARVFYESTSGSGSLNVILTAKGV